ncbi:UTP--glucose-1-phosphate uridylyltransferase [Streptomyces sulfonofaciens]|uniref:UTP--glucose-1-phosphate uridylyltransferase n=1 Tax=Streptomyces sulfonofaciens TaxID=68272 RepID=A0A919GL09_9ACTN|nr:UTP--glucose-1-phosphate uridylyltransferase [Streptomyces sulfonofaciens]GHH86447.1 UTP--glucose-1-phosphate uridylyltransferase [Streptomyces sulfonofaciens]
MSPTRDFHTAVVPAAGLGTRFLPATKSVPKELLPLLDTPGIELVAAEAADAGAERLIIVTAPGKDAIARHFRRDHELERRLDARGKSEMSALVQRASALLRIETTPQPEPLGLGHAVACAEPHLTGRDEAVAVLLPDDLVLPTGVLSRMAAVRRRHGGTVLCAFTAPRQDLSAYGVFDLAGTDEPGVMRVRAMVEKPDPRQAPSTFACAGRYLLDRAVFEPLRHVRAGPRGEIDLTDAICTLIDRGHPVHAVVHTGRRHDIGNPMGMLRASVEYALEDRSRGPAFRAWLRTRLSDDA